MAAPPWARKRGASLIRFHLQSTQIDEPDRTELAALADHLDHDDDAAVAVWQFAREYARASGDSPLCRCVNCRAYRAVHGDEETRA